MCARLSLKCSSALLCVCRWVVGHASLWRTLSARWRRAGVWSGFGACTRRHASFAVRGGGHCSFAFRGSGACSFSFRGGGACSFAFRGSACSFTLRGGACSFTLRGGACSFTLRGGACNFTLRGGGACCFTLRGGGACCFSFWYVEYGLCAACARRETPLTLTVVGVLGRFDGTGLRCPIRTWWRPNIWCCFRTWWRPRIWCCIAVWLGLR